MDAPKVGFPGPVSLDHTRPPQEAEPCSKSSSFLRPPHILTKDAIFRKVKNGEIVPCNYLPDPLDKTRADTDLKARILPTERLHEKWWEVELMKKRLKE